MHTDVQDAGLRKRSNGKETALKMQNNQIRGSGTPSRKIEAGYSLLDNNGVNVLMAAIMSVGSMIVASLWWDIPLMTIIR